MIKRNEKTPLDEVKQDYEININSQIATISELEYLADIVPQLQHMTHGLGERTLYYLFEMVLVEIKLQLDIEKYKSDTIHI